MPHPIGGYKLDGVKVPSVTTILGRFKDSGGLLYWAFEQGKACERGEISKLYDKRDEAAESGTLAHSMVEAHNNGTELPDTSGYPDEVVKQAKRGYENYLNWEASNLIQITHQEVELVSKAHKYGGCIDAIGVDPRGNKCLIDWKTSNNIYQDYLVQLAAYAMLWNENNPGDRIWGGFHLCRFSKEHADFAHHYWSELDDAEELFLLYRRAYDLDRSLKRRA